MSRGAVHVLIGVTGAVRQEIGDLLNDTTKDGNALRSTLLALHRERICQVMWGATTYHVYLITADEDVDNGDLLRIRNRWPSILVGAAWRQNGVQLGQVRAEDGTISGTPRYVLTTTRYNALMGAWPEEFIVMLGGIPYLTPPNLVQGQIRWYF